MNIFKNLGIQCVKLNFAKKIKKKEKRVFHVNVGHLNEAEIEAYIRKVVSKFKSTPYS